MRLLSCGQAIFRTSAPHLYSKDTPASTSNGSHKAWMRVQQSILENLKWCQHNTLVLLPTAKLQWCSNAEAGKMWWYVQLSYASHVRCMRSMQVGSFGKDKIRVLRKVDCRCADARPAGRNSSNSSCGGILPSRPSAFIRPF